MQPMVMLAVIAIILVIFQALMNVLQYKAVNKQYEDIRTHSHYVSVGTLNRFGRKRIAILGFSREGIVEECWILSGITFFARFRKIEKYDGVSWNELGSMLNEKNKEEMAIAKALEYMKIRMNNKASDEEYFSREENT